MKKLEIGKTNPTFIISILKVVYLVGLGLFKFQLFLLTKVLREGNLFAKPVPSSANSALQRRFRKIFYFFSLIPWIVWKLSCEIVVLQLKENNPDPVFIQFNQNWTIDYFSIYMFCTSCKPEIVLTIKTKTILCSQLVQNM